MSDTPSRFGSRHPFLQRLVRKNVLSGLMFMGIAGLGLWLSRDYPIGTLRRMNTGFMPQALCWLLMALGACVFLQGMIERTPAVASDASERPVSSRNDNRENYWSIAFVAASLVAFALTIEWLGLLVAIVVLVLIASFAYRGIAWWETLLTAAVLAVLCWAVFVLGLGLTVKLLPELG